MAPHAVDDLYNGCREKALKKFIDPSVLGKELNHSKEFQTAWGKQACDKLMPGKMKEHSSALNAYFHGGEKFIETLNHDVMTLGGNRSTYEKEFHFKSFHFLLVDSMTMASRNDCKIVYALVTGKKYSGKKGSKVRLGHFTMAHPTIKDLDVDLVDEQLLNITTCFFADMGPNVCLKKKASLLSPSEVFTLEDIQEVKDEDHDYSMIFLKHFQVKTLHNCYAFSR